MLSSRSTQYSLTKFYGSCHRFRISAHGLNFFAVCYGLRLANLQEFPRPQPRSFPSNYFGLGQFLHSLDVNPCTPTRNSFYAEKILMAVRKTLRDVTPCTGGGTFGQMPERLLQNFDTLWRYRKADETGQAILFSRFRGHQNFETANLDA